MPPAFKKRKMGKAPAEINFDFAAREEYLTGFHKRKVERKKLAEEENAKKERQERLRLRAEMRQQRKDDLVKHVDEVNRLVRQANGDIGVSNDDDEASGSEEEESSAPTPAPDTLNAEDEYIDEDKHTTVTIESVGISRYGFEDSATAKEAEEAEKEKEKRVWTKEKPKTNRPKKKKIKFRYETKTERKAERMKLGMKKKKLAEKRKAD